MESIIFSIDMMVAATAEANGCAVVTDNERHFDPTVPFPNPLRVKRPQAGR